MMCRMPRKTRGVALKSKAKVLAGLVAGKPITKIAAETGLSHDTVSQYVSRMPEVRSMLLQLKERNAKKIDQLYTMMLDSLGTDIKDKDPDVRFRARQEVIRLASLGETTKDGAPSEVAGEIDLQAALAVWIRSRKPKVIEAEVEVSIG